MAKSNDYNYNQEELSKIAEIREYLMDTNKLHVATPLRGCSDLDLGTQSNNIWPLLHALYHNGIELYCVDSASVPPCLQTLAQEQIHSYDYIQSSLISSVPNSDLTRTPQPGTKRTIYIKLISLKDYYNYSEFRSIFSKLYAMNNDYRYAQQILQPNVHASVWLQHETRNDTEFIYIIHSESGSRRNNNMLIKRLISMLPKLFNLELNNPEISDDVFISLVSNQKEKRMSVYNWLINKYADEVKEYLENKKYSELSNFSYYDENHYARMLSNIDDEAYVIFQNYKDKLKQRDKVAEKLLTIRYKLGNNADPIDELINYIKQYKPETLCDIKHLRDKKFRFKLTTPMMFYTPAEFNRLYENANTEMYKAGPLGILLNEVVNTNKIKLYFRHSLDVDFSSFSINQNSTQHTSGLEWKRAIQNPHLKAADCFGNNRAPIIEAMNSGNLIAMYEQMLGTVGSMNFSDGAIVPVLVEYITKASYTYDIKCFEITDTGQRFSYKEWEGGIINDFKQS